MNNIYIDVENINDNELLMLYKEEDENAKNLLYIKYKFIIDLLIKKYSRILKRLNIDYQEIYSECSVGFSDALVSYRDDKQTSLATFITLCVERRLRTIIRKYNRNKYKILQDTFSLDFCYEEGGSLIDLLSIDDDPLKEITDKENYKELIIEIKDILTKNEWEVFILMAKNFNYQEIAKILNKKPKQIDNAMQRIKIKIRNIMKEKSCKI